MIDATRAALNVRSADGDVLARLQELLTSTQQTYGEGSVACAHMWDGIVDYHKAAGNYQPAVGGAQCTQHKRADSAWLCMRRK